MYVMCVDAERSGMPRSKTSLAFGVSMSLSVDSLFHSIDLCLIVEEMLFLAPALSAHSLPPSSFLEI